MSKKYWQIVNTKNIIAENIPFHKIYDHDFFEKIINMAENELFIDGYDLMVETHDEDHIGIGFYYKGMICYVNFNCNNDNYIQFAYPIGNPELEYNIQFIKNKLNFLF